MRYVTTALAAVALLAVIVFSVQNLQSVDVSFLAWSMNTPTFVVVLGSYLLGMVSGWGLVELIKKLMQN